MSLSPLSPGRMAASGRYGLRQRNREPAVKAEAPDDETVRALLFLGLKPKVLSKRERQLFGGQSADYTSVRCVS